MASPSRSGSVAITTLFVFLAKDLSTSDQEKIALDLVEKHMKSLPL